MIKAKKADKKKRILKAATKVFAEYGFYNAKISQIAKLAKIADGTVYLYFKSKDDLLIHLFEEEMKSIVAFHKSEIDQQKSGQNKLLKFAENHAQLCEKNQDLAALFQFEIRQSNKFMKNYQHVEFANYISLIAEMIEFGQQSGEFNSKINVNMAKHSIFGAIDEISTHWILLPVAKRFDLKKSLLAFMQIFVNGLKS
ncbi:MAG: TetR/AcrR family transcriptional regulator [Calditrichaeota bacterium]|nr:TetR/AcrR family transcriptional regulator [Calditrichota bacterium]